VGVGSVDGAALPPWARLARQEALRQGAEGGDRREVERARPVEGQDVERVGAERAGQGRQERLR